MKDDKKKIVTVELSKKDYEKLAKKASESRRSSRAQAGHIIEEALKEKEPIGEQ